MKSELRYILPVLMLLGSGCATGVNAFCANDTPILPSEEDVLSNGTAMRIDAHDQHFEEQCR
jgi:hypothetical protein